MSSTAGWTYFGLWDSKEDSNDSKKRGLHRREGFAVQHFHTGRDPLEGSWDGIAAHGGLVTAGWWSQDKRSGPFWMYTAPTEKADGCFADCTHGLLSPSLGEDEESDGALRGGAGGGAGGRGGEPALMPRLHGCVRLVWFKHNKIAWTHTVRSQATQTRVVELVDRLQTLGSTVSLATLESASSEFRRLAAAACSCMLTTAASEFQQQGLQVAELASFAVSSDKAFAHLFINGNATSLRILCGLLALSGRHRFCNDRPHCTVDLTSGRRWPPRPVTVRPLCLRLHTLCDRPANAVLEEADAERVTLRRLLDCLAKTSSNEEIRCLQCCAVQARAPAKAESVVANTAAAADAAAAAAAGAPGLLPKWPVTAALLWRGRAIASDADLCSVVRYELRAKSAIEEDRKARHKQKNGDNRPVEPWIQLTHLCWNAGCPNQTFQQLQQQEQQEQRPQRRLLRVADDAEGDCFFCKRGRDDDLGELRALSGVKKKGAKVRQIVHLHDLCVMSMPEYVEGCDEASIVTAACARQQFERLCPLCRLPGTTLQCCGRLRQSGRGEKHKKGCSCSFHFGCAFRAGCGFTSHLGWVVFCPQCLRSDPDARMRLAFPARHCIQEWSGIWTAPLL